MVRSIHLPTLARLPDLFRVGHICDVDLAAARAVAGTVGARWSSSVTELLQDSAVDVVAVCSPHQLHTDHVVAACEAGVRAILCEKPLATSVADAARIAATARRTGTSVILGSMHLFDPAWAFLRQHFGPLRGDGGGGVVGDGGGRGGATTVRSNIMLPFNDRFERWATEPDGTGPLPEVDHSTAAGRAASITIQLLGLAIHDLPLVRAVAPQWREVEVISADVMEPLGYRVQLRAGPTLIELSGGFRDHWQTEWEFAASDEHSIARVEFTPSFVQAGSGTARITDADTTWDFPGSDSNGYEGEWRSLAQTTMSDANGSARLEGYVADLEFALVVADAVATHIEEEQQ